MAKKNYAVMAHLGLEQEQHERVLILMEATRKVTQNIAKITFTAMCRRIFELGLVEAERKIESFSDMSEK